MKKYFKLLRIKHYLKNFLILLPLVFGKELFNFNLWLKIIPGFISFCFLSSTVYIFNDIKDKDRDKNHYIKCKRPIASGEISVKNAIIFAIFLFVLSLVFNFFTFSSWYALLLLLLYLALNLGYSLGLKNVPILDVCILVSGFFIRVFYGSIITNIEISNWMYLTVIMLSFYLGLGKRRNEFQNNKYLNTRTVLKFYNQNFLDKFMYLCLTISIIFYSLWCIDSMTINNYGNRFIWTIPFILILCMKYNLDIEGNSDGDPINVIFNDKILLICSIIFVIVLGILIYL